ncbi:unnamed protein product, partial [Gongylonema pulchrum]
MECAVKGSPQPTVQFFQESTRITSNSHYSVEHDVSNVHWRVVIEKTDESDFTKYRALAINAVGTAESEAEIKHKKVDRKPIFDEGLKSRKVTEGDEIVLEVKFSGVPQPEVKWFKDSQEIVDEMEKVTVKVEGNRSVLTIQNAKLEESGRYSVEIVNSEGKETSSADVTVEVVAKAPEFTEKLLDVEIKELETVELKVTATGVPTPEISWYKDGVPIQVDSERILVKEGEAGQHILIVKQARLEDAGSYSCKATNKVGADETKAQFAVQEVLEAPQFTDQLSELKVTETETAELSVTVTGKPEPEVLWAKDGIPVNIDNVHIATKKDEHGHYSLIIKDARLEDAGVYSCKATSRAGEAESKAQFAVEQTVTEVPEFLEGLQELSVQEHETAELSVSVVGKPVPQVAWFKDGMPVNIDNSHILECTDETGHFTLVIKDARAQDVGAYSCKATNIAGSVETRMNFAVETVVEAPQFTDKLQDVTVTETETAEISVTVTGKPEPEVKWFKDDMPVNIDQVHIAAKQDETGTHTLIIKEARLEDAGIYSCIATNVAGQAEQKAKFAVETEVEVPQFVEGLKEISVQEQETAELSVTVAGKPEPQVQWFKNGIPVNIDNSHFIVKRDVSGQNTLIIKEAHLEDIGTYSCKATNQAGIAESEAKFAVECVTEAPKFTEGLQELSVQEAETAQLSVTVVGKPEPEVAWFKDGIPVNIDNEHILSKKDEKGQYTLVIKEARMEDVGIYTCKATNQAGTAESEAKFAVECVTETPTFLEGLQELSVQEAETAKLSVTVTGKPEPEIAWFKDGVPINIDNEHILSRKDEEGHYTLTIKNAHLEDVGTYSCKATNLAGTAESEAKFAVE